MRHATVSVFQKPCAPWQVTCLDSRATSSAVKRCGELLRDPAFKPSTPKNAYEAARRSRKRATTPAHTNSDQQPSSSGATKRQTRSRGGRRQRLRQLPRMRQLPRLRRLPRRGLPRQIAHLRRLPRRGLPRKLVRLRRLLRRGLVRQLPHPHPLPLWPMTPRTHNSSRTCGSRAATDHLPRTTCCDAAVR